MAGYRAEAIAHTRVPELSGAAFESLRRGTRTPALDAALMKTLLVIATRATCINKHPYDPPTIRDMVVLPIVNAVKDGELGADMLLWINRGKVTKVRRPWGDREHTNVPEFALRRQVFNVYVGENPTLNYGKGGVSMMFVSHDAGKPETLASSMILLSPLIIDAGLRVGYRYSGSQPRVNWSQSHGTVSAVSSHLAVSVGAVDGGGMGVLFEDGGHGSDLGVVLYHKIGELSLNDLLEKSRRTSY